MNDDVFKRIPPHNLEAEQCALGAVLLDNDTIETLRESLTADDFYSPAHREIYRAMIELADQPSPIDAITLKEWLRKNGKLESVGGPTYVAELAGMVPTTAHTAYYAEMVHEGWLRRKQIAVGNAIISRAFEPEGNGRELLEQAESEIFQLAERGSQTDFSSTPDLAPEVLKDIDWRVEHRGQILGLAFGLPVLDHEIGGLDPGDVAIIAGRPSMGKTAAALNIIAHNALRCDPPVGTAFFSLEMSKKAVMLRLACTEARVDSTLVKTGNLNAEEIKRLSTALEKLAAAPIYIDDSSDIRPVQLRAKCRRLFKQHRDTIGLICVDYLQLMGTPSDRSERRDLDIAQISRSLKALAKELNVPLIALSQLNRQVEYRANRRPGLADLRESGALEQDADVVVFIYRDEYYNTDSPDKGVAELIIGKVRNGDPGAVKVGYVPRFTLFAPLEKFHPESDSDAA
jgi:replicative DNA helicase